MQCRDFEPFFSQYIDGELERNRSESIRFHLSGCPQCRLILEEMLQAVNAVRGLPRLAPRSEFAEALRQRLHQEITQDLYRRPGWIRWAAGLAELWRVGLQRAPQIAVASILVVAVGVGMFLFQSGPPAGRVNGTLNTQRPALSFDQPSAVSPREERARAERSGDAPGSFTRVISSNSARQDIDTPGSRRSELASPMPESTAFSLASNPNALHWVIPEVSGDGVVVAETSPATVQPRQALPFRSAARSERLFDLTGQELTGTRGPSSEPARGSIIGGRRETMHYLLPTIPSRPSLSRVAF